MAEHNCKSVIPRSEVPSAIIRRNKVGYMRRHPDFTQISSLTLKGHWLAAAGFPIGTEVDIRVMSGCLVITPRKSDLDEPEFIHSLRKLSARKQRQVEEYIGLVASNGS